MKNTFKIALVAVFSLVGIATVKASSGTDLLIGITQQGGNSSGKDLLYDIGPVISYPGATGLTNGKSWDLSSLITAQGFTLANVQWGVLGDASYADGASTQTLWVTTGGNTPTKLVSDSAWNAIDNPITQFETDFGYDGLTTWSSPDESTNIVATHQNSWNEQTINGTLGSQFVNAYGLGAGAPNVTGTTSATLWQVPADNSDPTKIGTFTLSAGGVLTFNVIGNTPPPPRIVSITRAGTTSTVYFTTTNGSYTYTLYFTNSTGLATSVTNWPSGGSLTGNGLTNSLSDTTATTNRFYRVGVQ